MMIHLKGDYIFKGTSLLKLLAIEAHGDINQWVREHKEYFLKKKGETREGTRSQASGFHGSRERDAEQNWLTQNHLKVSLSIGYNQRFVEFFTQKELHSSLSVLYILFFCICTRLHLKRYYFSKKYLALKCFSGQEKQRLHMVVLYSIHLDLTKKTR